MPGFLGAVSAACFRHRDGTLPDLPLPEGDRSMRLPPWALLRPRDGEFEEGQSSRTPTRKRIRVERESSSDSSDETAPIESDPSDSDDDKGPDEGSDDDEISKEDSEEDPEEGPEEDPKEGMMGGDDPDEEEPQIGGLADLGIELVPPQPVGPPPEIPLPPAEPHPEELQQSLHPVDLAFYRGLYLYATHVDRDFVSRPHIPIAPVAAPELPEPVVVPEYPEELLSPIEALYQGTRYGDPVWISSDSEQE